MHTLSADHDRYLREHRWALVNTTRDDGSPQASLVAYHYDGHDIVVSCRGRTAKFVNARKRPRVAVSVIDDDRYLTVHGTADCIATGSDRDALTARLRDSLLPQHAALLDKDIDRGLDAAGRVILRIRPESAVGRV